MMKTRELALTLNSEILDGSWDDYLDGIVQAVEYRRKQVLRRMKAGDKVMIRPDAKITPAYIRGVPLVVVSLNRETMKIRGVEPLGKYGTGQLNINYEYLIPLPA